MSVQVKIPPFLRHLTEDLTTANVNGSTVGDCVVELVRRFPGIKEEILDQDGELHEYVEICVNNKTTYPEGLSKAVKDGDEIFILNVIAGG